MITAQEALFNTIQNTKNIKIPEIIEKGILDSCNKGSWYFDFEGVIETPVEKLLEVLNYQVDRYIILGKPITKISWK